MVIVACPAGMWNQVHDVVCDEEDIKHIRKLRKEYKNLNRNLWNPFDKNHEKQDTHINLTLWDLHFQYM